jgi:pimeloyl-ACP methyl ester carboxylesterase
MGFGIELARRGFVVLTIDAVGHGNSDPSVGPGTDAGGIVALDFLASLSFVSSIGMIGHSMGAGIALAALNASTIQVDALVLVGGGVRNIGTWANNTYPPNMLVALGIYDELYNIPQLQVDLTGPFNTSGVVVPGNLYGSFSLGTARKLVLTPTNHLFETIDPVIIGETTEWLLFSLKGAPDLYWIPSHNLIYPLWILGGFIASLGAVLSVFALLTILINWSFFRKIKQPPSSTYSAKTSVYLGFGLVYGVIGLGLILTFFLIDLPFDVPQSIGIALILGFFTSSIISLLLLLGIKSFQNKKATPPTWNDYGGFNGNSQSQLKTIGLGFLLGVIGIFWLYLIVLPVDLLLHLDFRAFLPFMKALSPLRAQFLPIYFLLLLPCFMVEGLWLMGFLRTTPQDTWIKTQTLWTIKSIFIKCLLFGLVILIQSVVSIALGRAFITGFIGFNLLYLYMFVPMFAISTTLLAWSYRISNRFYIAVIFNAFLFAWVMAAILPIYL